MFFGGSLEVGPPAIRGRWISGCLRDLGLVTLDSSSCLFFWGGKGGGGEGWFRV